LVIFTATGDGNEYNKTVRFICGVLGFLGWASVADQIEQIGINNYYIMLSDTLSPVGTADRLRHNIRPDDHFSDLLR
jgi:hypothetical protein